MRIEAKSGDMTGSDGAQQELGEPVDGARLVERIVRALPLGLSVKTAEGAPLYANDAAVRHRRRSIAVRRRRAGARPGSRR